MGAERNTDVICVRVKDWLEMRASALCGLFDTMTPDEAWWLACREFRRLINARVMRRRAAA